jgi:hypothetical protein
VQSWVGIELRICKQGLFEVRYSDAQSALAGDGTKYKERRCT